jgi:hypothetical protein
VHRLRTCRREVDNREASLAQANATVLCKPYSARIRPAMGKGGRHLFKGSN